MLLFPLPFLTAFFIIFVLLQLVHSNNRGLPVLTLITLVCYAVQSILLGINWGIHTLSPIYLLNISTLLPPLTWLTLNELSGRLSRGTKYTMLGVIVALVAVINASVLFDLEVITDTVSIALYASFGLHLIWLGWRRDMEWMENRPLHSVLPTQRAFFIAGAILLISASVDVMILIDIQLNNQQISSAVVGYSNLVLLLILLVMFFRVGEPSQRPPESITSRRLTSDKPVTILDSELAEILEKLDNEMNTTHLYRNESLSLNRIASKIRVPSRQISMAVNSLKAMNVPQYVNTFRIKDACRMLEETETPVTEIVFAIGFTTKSNFNREFLRVTGLSPSAWRERARERQSNEKPAIVPLREPNRGQL